MPTNWQQWEVELTGENQRSKYYKVNGVTVIFTEGDGTQNFCGKCRLSVCDHVKRLSQWRSFNA